MTHQMPEYFASPRRFEFVTVPGIGNSGPDHWQTWIEDVVGGFMRIELSDWKTPDIGRWKQALASCLTTATRPAILVAHSFGCLAAAEVALDHPEQVAGLLLAAPADPSRFLGLATPRRDRLACPGVLVASRNDPWMEIDVARDWAGAWGLDFWDEGRAGHINVASGHGRWIAGLNAFSHIYFAARDPALSDEDVSFKASPVVRKSHASQAR